MFRRSKHILFKTAGTRLFLLSVLLTAIPRLSVYSQIQSAVSWKFSIESKTDSFLVILAEAEISEGWRLSSHLADEQICIPLTMTFKESDDYTPEGDLLASEKPTTEYGESKTDEMLIYRYHAEFRQKVKLHTREKIVIQFNLYGQCCHPVLKVCSPILMDETFYVNY